MGNTWFMRETPNNSDTQNGWCLIFEGIFRTWIVASVAWRWLLKLKQGHSLSSKWFLKKWGLRKPRSCIMLVLLSSCICLQQMVLDVWSKFRCHVHIAGIHWQIGCPSWRDPWIWSPWSWKSSESSCISRCFVDTALCRLGTWKAETDLATGHKNAGGNCIYTVCTQCLQYFWYSLVIKHG